MRKQMQPIDATKYDIRVLWTGPKEDHISRDAGVVEGYPLDPPDDFTGWLLVDWGVESTKDTDRYWGLWIREKSRKRKARVAKPKAASKPAAGKVAEEKPAKAPRQRKPRTTPTQPSPAAESEAPAPAASA